MIQGELGADPLHPDLRTLLDEAEDIAEDALWETIAWAGKWWHCFDESAEAEVRRIFEGAA